MVFSGIVPRLQQKITSLPIVSRNETLKYYLEHEAGPFTSMYDGFSLIINVFEGCIIIIHMRFTDTVHFWAPSFKWCISVRAFTC